VKSKQNSTFNVQAFLDSAGISKKIVEYRRADVIFAQGDPCNHVLYIQKGGVKLSVLSKDGREAVVAMLEPGEFFGEGALAGQPLRMGSATATTDSTILLVDKDRMVRLLHKQHALSDRFIAHILARNIRIEEDLIDSCSTPVRSAWRGRSCCWRGTASTINRYDPCRRSLRRRWRK
jgi:CRP/FNR family cyclic AMP-dependent transcriptional regulator